jgi:metal-dependent amidase/aminoacylase/carboxypeptidase family protein
VHGVINHGGDAANVIPDYTDARFLVRAKEQDDLELLRQKFRNIVEAAALATGCSVKIHEGLSYESRVCNSALVETFGENVVALGLNYDEAPADGGVGSSDIGNVSRIVPTIHPYLQICDPGVGGHTPEFEQASASERADELTATGATLLAWTAADVLLRPELRTRLRKTFREELGYDPRN